MILTLGKPEYWYMYIVVRILSSFYAYLFEIRIHWGLTFSTKFSTFLLRPKEKLIFPKKFYYFAMIVNFFIRFLWLIFYLVPIKLYSLHGDIDVYKTYFMQLGFGLIAELLRRTLWAIIRVENEQMNNFEGYRIIFEVPPVVDKNEDH